MWVGVTQSNECLRVAIDGDDVCALCDEALGGGETNATGSAGDEDGAVGKSLHK
jgi:hypothetical protein